MSIEPEPTQFDIELLAKKEKKFREQWLRNRASTAKYLMDGDKVKRQQIDTWAVVDDLGLTPHEFRLLYCIARHEKWKTAGKKKELVNGCYASAAKLQEITGISRNKIFEILDFLQKANLIHKIGARGKQGRTGTSLAGWTNEYAVMPIRDWSTPWEITELRAVLKSERLLKKKSKTKRQKKSLASDSKD